ncbi:putative plasma membrane zinc ion transporter [Aspergillus clavatus NRRL 1]|uniref:Plasma membrane zinc ion transporter, putative n=1 Tax=Aspergillus clavatus (strain ATCC 1007 / CBS 513.65 / DSM 816 / NCTC 3887 / NRRL 1 / QM 1276 / 107) TaxID=344612 RepID=A1CN45_ASPCL|nr:plasma membrane zinc ion transporter, putative [Aspergillus clavatus NRRL 1]EAW08982.1 plasma membrane zinc ion transporter, putative [Aspergillus clavatus NRRL 1]
MNCPSRTDDTLLHCDWNQNPPSLAPDLTTRQDLNGISNARVHKSGGLAVDSLTCLQTTQCLSSRPKTLEKVKADQQGASLTLSGRPVSLKARDSTGQIYYPSHCSTQSAPSSLEKIKSWAWWLLSVLFTSAVISHEIVAKYLGLTVSFANRSDGAEAPARLLKRSTCAEGGANRGDYNTPLHVAALFIILAVSTLACAFPILATWFPRLRIPPSFLFVVSHFGTGVLIATAFVHLLPTAFTSLNNPCLSSFWTSDYPAMPGAIALAGIFLVTVIEMVFSPARHVCRGGLRVSEQKPCLPDHGIDNAYVPKLEDPAAAEDPMRLACPRLESQSHLRDLGPLIGRSSSMSRTINRIGEDSDRIIRIASAPGGSPTLEESKMQAVEDVERSDEFTLAPEQKHRKAVMQVLLLEMGILFHSVFIGMSLSVSVGSEFVILLIAIVFHQTFEGLALGSRIAALDWPESAMQPWLMSLAYGCTTPIGQAIGLATHTLYSPDSEVGLLLVGTMNAISSGLLIFASLVELMSEDFLSDESWRVLRGRKRVIACVLVFAGAFCMSLVGAWA